MFVSTHAPNARRSRLAGAVALCALGAGLAGFVPTASASGGKGYTFGVYAHDPVLGVDHVGNYGTGNPYTGDTICKYRRPILCVDVDGSARPNYVVTPGGNEFYQGWVEGHYTTTLPVAGTALLSQAHANGLCAASFGPGWRMAEFHDGAYATVMDATHNWGVSPTSSSPWTPGHPHGGWSAWGFGHVQSSMRMWVAINDQPGNCWNP